MDFLGWLKDNYPKKLKSHDYDQDLVAGREYRSCCCQAKWWEWTGGPRSI
jgi:hypothetical protein